MSNWFDDDNATPEEQASAAHRHKRAQPDRTPAANEAEGMSSRRRRPSSLDENGMVIQPHVRRPQLDSDWVDAPTPAIMSEADEYVENDETSSSTDGQESASEFSENDFAGEENDQTDGGEANLEFDRDKFYDNMSTVGAVVGVGGTVTGNPAAGIAGGVIKGTAFAGKQVGHFIDGAMHYADDAAHERHKNGELKAINSKKDQQALDKINQGQGKHGSRVTKDD